MDQCQGLPSALPTCTGHWWHFSPHLGQRAPFHGVPNRLGTAADRATPKQREHAPLAPNCTETSPEPFRKRRSQPDPPHQPNTCTKAPSLQRGRDLDCDVCPSPGSESSELSLPDSVCWIQPRWWGLGNNHSYSTGWAHRHACPSHKPQCLGVATNKSNLLQGQEENLAGVGSCTPAPIYDSSLYGPTPADLLRPQTP